MKHYAGIDVSVESSSVCVVDAEGQIVWEAKVPSEPDDRFNLRKKFPDLLRHRPSASSAPISESLASSYPATMCCRGRALSGSVSGASPMHLSKSVKPRRRPAGRGGEPRKWYKSAIAIDTAPRRPMVAAIRPQGRAPLDVAQPRTPAASA